MEATDTKRPLSEKQAEANLPLPTSSTSKATRRTAAPWWTPLKYLIPAVLVARVALPFILPDVDLPFASTFSISNSGTHASRIGHKSSCEQADPIYPSSFDVSAEIQGKKGKVVEWLSGAVKIPTEIFDVMGPIGEDPRWDVFYKFADCTYSSSWALNCLSVVRWLTHCRPRAGLPAGVRD
jgi:Gly-Xaa carboxypeptidase